MKKQRTTMDYFVLAVVILMIAGALVKGHMVRSLPETASFTYQMTLSGLEGEIAPGDTILCTAGKQSVGTVVELDARGEQPVLTIQAQGFPIEGGWRTNVYDILPGFEFDFYTQSASWYGIVTGIS